LKIILKSFTPEPIEISAKSSYISHSSDKVTKIFEKNFSDPLGYIKKIITMGHLSVLEHIYFNFLIEDAPLINEIFLIRFRLASFTVKSRRYTNVIEDGFYEDEYYKIDNNFKKKIINFYEKAIINNINLEDARFVLPLSSKTNMVFSVNARELGYILYSGLYEENHSTIKKMAEMLREEANKVFPIYYDLDYFAVKKMNIFNVKSSLLRITDSVEILNKDEIKIKEYENAIGFTTNNNLYSENQFDLKKSLLLPHNRALEFINIIVFIKNISIPALTHLLRHRIQSIIVPYFEKINSNYLIPESFEIKGLTNEFLDIIIESKKLEKSNILNRLVSSTYPVLTNINAREMLHIMRLRLCNRAQWEIRNIFTDILFKLRKINQLFNYIGPSCFIFGLCPEGNKTCKKIKEVINFFEPN